MAFIDQDDLELYIDSDELAQITDGNVDVIPEAIAEAEEYVAEMLRQRFDMAAEYALVDAARNQTLVKNVVAIALFFINERLPMNILPEARGFAYERAEDWLKQVAKGERMTSLTQLDADNQKGWPIRYGTTKAGTTNKY